MYCNEVREGLSPETATAMYDRYKTIRCNLDMIPICSMCLVGAPQYKIKIKL